MSNVCCTCANIITSETAFNGVSEKAVPNKRLDCCGRLVCSECIQRNPRFGTYCAFCQTPTPITPVQAASSSSAPSSSLPPPAAAALPPPPPSYSEGLQPPHTPPAAPRPQPATLAEAAPDEQPPPYSAEDHGPGSNGAGSPADGKQADVLHHLCGGESVASLSVAYGVPAGVLRRHNGLWSDHLLAARKMVLIPGGYYRGPSLAPDPAESAEEAERKAKIRRLMTGCKIHDYDVAVLYLEQARWRFDDARHAYLDDERWEKENPLGANAKGKGLRSGLASEPARQRRAAEAASSIGRRLATTTRG